MPLLGLVIVSGFLDANRSSRVWFHAGGNKPSESSLEKR
jgi:hypothetical protein